MTLGIAMFHRFQFEAAFYPTLERLRFHVRMKLDLTGIRVSLHTWQTFSMEERRALCHLPADTDEEREVFAAFLDALARAR
ncbi:MAG: nitrate reductase associated protein, partial [Deltaproteobacteria bacterium]|nr:nitrate reductase associated protein [Deltaproteobacteria bacterium]